jgi:hypothetical protein
MRYDEAGQFFIREMEMKRKYEEISSYSWKNIFRLKWKLEKIRSNEKMNVVEIRLNNWVIRNFSLTGLYYHLSKYGQSFSRPTLFGIGIVALSTLLWSSQANPTGNFTFTGTGFSEVSSTNLEKAFTRSITNFLPLLPTGTGTQLGLVDLIFKIVGGAVTFGLIIVALRRKFERKFRH